MRNTGTGVGKPTFLEVSGSPVVPPTFKVDRSRPIPRIISIGVRVSELLFGGQAI
jgi:hypothetical protein